MLCVFCSDVNDFLRALTFVLSWTSLQPESMHLLAASDRLASCAKVLLLLAPELISFRVTKSLGGKRPPHCGK
jgi:hypothetical protein